MAIHGALAVAVQVPQDWSEVTEIGAIVKPSGEPPVEPPGASKVMTREFVYIGFSPSSTQQELYSLCD
jgi:hypothetical protein